MFRTCVLAVVILLSCSGSVDSTLLKLADCYVGIGFRASLTLYTMFYSVDLLSLKGGRMNMIWLLGTQRLYKIDLLYFKSKMFHTQGQDCLDQEEEIGIAEDGSDGSVQRACNKVGFQGIDLFLDHRCPAGFPCKARRRASPFACQPRWCTASASI